MRIRNVKGTGHAPGGSAPRAAWLTLGALGLLLGWAQSAAAQPVTGQPVAVFRFAEQGQPVMAVDVWGSVRQTGRYFVQQGTGLVDLITIAGGPALPAETEQVVRGVTVEVSRAAEAERSVIFTAELDALTAGGVFLPSLLDGDVVTVRTSVSQRFTWLDGLTVAASVASLALIILRVTNLSGGI